MAVPPSRQALSLRLTGDHDHVRFAAYMAPSVKRSTRLTKPPPAGQPNMPGNPGTVPPG
jgi:hypothetical protein